MALLLLRQRAQEPYCFDKLNLGAWSLRELCYMIFTWPVLFMDGIIGEDLFVWLGSQLGEQALAERLRKALRSGTDTCSILTMILEEGDFYSPAEISAFAIRLRKLESSGYEELVSMTAEVYLDSGRLESAFEEYGKLAVYYDENLAGCEDPAERERLLGKKAACCCDMAEIRIRLMDNRGALDLLVTAELCCPLARAEELRYLINGAGNIPESSREYLDSLREKAAAKAEESDAVKEIDQMFECDDDRTFALAEEMIKNWKKEYRRINR